MWAVSNDTPYSADRAFVRDRDGAEIWIVAVRATYDILPDGRVALAKTQVPVALAPAWMGKPAESSLRWDMDMVRTKLGTDVVLHASAHAPQGKPTEEVEVGFAVGPIQKRLRVFGDRIYHRPMLVVKPDPPRPFETMPITYERTYGGQSFDDETGALTAQHDENPLGMGLVSHPGFPCHNTEYPGDAKRPLTNRVRAASFGPIPASWQPRVGLAGTYDKNWEETRLPLLPDDFRDEYFYSAPADQQVPGFLSGGEEVTLVNLTPDGLTRFLLPRVRLGFTTSIDGATVNHRGNLHTVIIEPTERRLIMVWHTALPCHHTLYTLKQTLVIEKKRIQKHEPETAVLA